jgi:hypothetical protein
MTKRQIEMWVVQLIDQAIAKQHVEDSHVELKSRWPEVSPVSKARETARMIGGHTNAVPGADPFHTQPSVSQAVDKDQFTEEV